MTKHTMLSEEEKERARLVTRQAMAQVSRRRWWGSLGSTGVVPAAGLAPTRALAAVTKERSGWNQSAPSDDGRVRGTVLVTPDGDLWVGFETRDPELAGRTIAFALRDAVANVIRYEGEVALVPTVEGVWEGRKRLGRQQTLGIEGDCELVFGVKGPEEELHGQPDAHDNLDGPAPGTDGDDE